VSEPLFSFRAWANRLLALIFNVPALPYVWLRFPDEEFRRYAKSTARCLITGKGGL
jgi:hypothetical protein